MFAYWGIILLQRFLLLFPAGLARFLGRLGGGLYYYADKKHRKIARENLRRALGGGRGEKELRVIARRSFSQLGFNLVEFLLVPRLIRPGWKKKFRLEGGNRIKSAFGQGKGIIFVLAHFGNWEYLGLIPRLLSFRAVAVAQKIKNPAVDGLIRDIRERIGLDLFPKFHVVSSILGYLKKNGAVAILADQRARKMNIRVDFFGHPAATTAAPAVLALKSGAALLPAFIYYEGKGNYRMVIEEKIALPSGLAVGGAVRKITQDITALFEEKIKERPELWLWGHRRWRMNG
jgi:KDO2-lipid IV(A) lauroyltransferase